jgi:5-deoxy-glucuronate isomerase
MNAGWGYVGFGLYRLKAGEVCAERTANWIARSFWCWSRARRDFRRRHRLWRDGRNGWMCLKRHRPHCLYVPNGSHWEAVAKTDCTLAVCKAAPGKSGHTARRIGPDGISLTPRGHWNQ